jgi:hypothetical protein
MKPVKTLLVAALAAAGMGLAIDAEAARGSWGGGGHWGGGHWRGHFYGPRLGLYIGAPLLWSSLYWGYPYGYGYYYPRTVIYREVERYPQSYPEGYLEPAPTTEVPRTEGAPTRAPAYMNYCDSAKAYFPKVTSCPEGWRFEPAR